MHNISKESTEMWHEWLSLSSEVTLKIIINFFYDSKIKTPAFLSFFLKWANVLLMHLVEIRCEVQLACVP